MRGVPSRENVQDRLSSLLGCEPETRPGVIERMLFRSPSEVTGYWLQLIVAAGIATLGLVLGSTAVVIGAMLVAPLMGPIVSLGMGLAVGSPFLVLRGVTRVVLSVVVVTLFAAILTRLLPFQEMNDEIAARTTPTALDLATAAFCAVAGVYAAMRPASDVAATAAGTSIGISLVPPLCVAGYGLGTASWSVAYGAALLFSTNFVAIVAVGSAAFAASGFARVDIAALETATVDADRDAPFARRLAARLSRLFASRSGPWLRILMPLALLAAVYVPLRKGLDEVAWQIGARHDVQRAVAGLPGRVVESRVKVERGGIELDIFLLGGQDDAQSAEKRLRDQVSAETGVVPRVDVFAVPDAAEFEALERTLQKPAPPPAAAPPPEPPAATRLGDALQAVEAAVAARWPQDAAGEPLAVVVERDGGQLVVTVTHFGDDLGAAAREALGRALTGDLEIPVTVRARALPVGDVALAPGDLGALLAASRAVEAASRVPLLAVCVAMPPAPVAPKKERAPEAELRAALAALVADHPHAAITEGPWSVRVVEGDCP